MSCKMHSLIKGCLAMDFPKPGPGYMAAMREHREAALPTLPRAVQCRGPNNYQDHFEANITLKPRSL